MDCRQPFPHPIMEELPVTRAQSQRASLKRLWRGHFDEYPTPAMISAHIRLNRLPLTSRPSIVLRAKHWMASPDRWLIEWLCPHFGIQFFEWRDIHRV